MNGPQAATGKLCPEGWTLYRMPGPQFKGLDPSGSANHAYYLWVDRYNTLGLGNDVPIAMAKELSGLRRMASDCSAGFRRCPESIILSDRSAA